MLSVSLCCVCVMWEEVLGRYHLNFILKRKVDPLKCLGLCMFHVWHGDYRSDQFKQWFVFSVWHVLGYGFPFQPQYTCDLPLNSLFNPLTFHVWIMHSFFWLKKPITLIKNSSSWPIIHPQLTSYYFYIIHTKLS